MDSVLKSILSRVLTQEIKNQREWEREDIELGIDFGERKEYIKKIEEFMSENGIEKSPWFM